MLALKTKTLSLPHLSLSRTSSPSRSQPPTPTGPPVSPGDAEPLPVSAGSERSTSSSSSPKFRAVDAAAAAAAPPKPSRRSSIGASLSAFTSRSSSPAAGVAAPKSPSFPSGLTLTPASSEPPSPGGGGSARPTRSASDDKSGLRPLRTSRATSSSGKKRSKSSDRAADLVAASTPLVAPTPVPTAASAAKTKKPGLMASFGRGLALGSSQSQPGMSRATATAVRASAVGGADYGTGALTPAGGAAAGSRSPVLGATTSFTPAAHSGTATPSSGAHAHGHGHGHHAPSVQLHQLAESYVGKVGLRLGEAVNKVFLPLPTGPGGIVDKAAEKAEAPFGGHAVAWKGRAAPRLARAKEVGELITAELQAALHDPYLLRTLLRSSVLKALSLFLTRLSALLLVASPTDPLLTPGLFAAPRTAKEADALSLPLRFNLQIVRCAYEVKHALAVVADPAAGFPHFVEETLKPWRVKLAELINRVMGPFVQSARLAVAEACARARIEGAAGEADAAAAALVASSLGLHGLGPSAAPAMKTSATSQLRSLSLGRAATPTPGASATAYGHHPPLSAAATAAGPGWLRDLAAQLDAFVRVVGRLECGHHADKWLVSVATAACWKGMLHLSARAVGSVAAAHAPEAGERPHTATGEKVVRRGLLGGVTMKKTPSPPQSPPLPAVELSAPAAAPAPSAADVAFVRLLSDLELLEARLKGFLVASLSTPAPVLAPSASSTAPCPAAAGPTGCGLCRTGRTFDDESSDSSEDDEDNDGEVSPGGSARRADPGRESRLALSAMREAMQAISAMVVVVRASKDLGVLRQAIEGTPADAPPPAAAAVAVPNAPLTPSALFALAAAPSAQTAVTVLPPPSALSASCPTLSSALLTLPPLLLLHLLASRLPSRGDFRLPHELWGLRGGWAEYAAELRGFAAAEEWEVEVAWEMGGEAERVLALTEEERKERGAALNKGAQREKDALEAIRAAARRTSGGGPPASTAAA
ncbi:hypothetical protein JCM10450v2_006020 [Rhodotorula kratochvilovae]